MGRDMGTWGHGEGRHENGNEDVEGDKVLFPKVT